MNKLNYLQETPSQTAGPYVHIGLAPGAAGFDIYSNELGWKIAGPQTKGTRIRVEGIVTDGTGNPIKDVMLEVWQPNASGCFAHPEGGGSVEQDFRGWGRVITDFATGEWAFNTVKPGSFVDGKGRVHAPHINLWLVARGINLGLNTRLYFDDEPEANSADPVLNLIEWESRRPTLIAKLQPGADLPTYRFEIRIQGEGETVFFDI